MKDRKREPQMKKQHTIHSIPLVITITIFSIIINLLIFIIPLLVNKIVNRELEITAPIIMGILLVMMIQILLQLMLILLQNHCMKKYKIRCCTNLYQKIFSMRYDKLIGSGTTYLVQRADAAALTLAQLSIKALPILISKSLIVLIILVYSIRINVLLFAIMAGMTIANIWGFFVLNKKLAEKSVYMQNHIPKEREDIYQIAAQVDFLKQNADNTVINPILERHLEKIEEINKQVNTVANGGSSIIDFFNMFLENMVLIVLTYLFIIGKNGMGDILTITAVMAYFVPAIMSIVSVNLDMRELKASKEFIRFLDENKEEAGTVQIEGIENIEVDAERLGVDGAGCLLRNVKLRAEKGDVVGIIGESGTGKSTLLKNLLKYWKSAGIKVNGIPLETIENQSYRQHISYYSQNPVIITGTVGDNLSFGRVQDKDDFEKFSFLKKFQDEDAGWSREILENGNNLSGGDKQKISLARMMTDTADVLLLDEPTSSLDSDTEEQILDELFAESQGRIVILVTHRPSNLKYCNKIYKIADGSLQQVEA